jgi:hypothetical protein
LGEKIMFEIEMLPAREGDCLWVRYGNAKKTWQILIDGGRASTGIELKRRLAELPANRRGFELLIVTHVDRDHIEGALGLLEDPHITPRFKDIWFNGYDHLHGVPRETFGALQGERLSGLLANGLPWNRRWKGGAVCIEENCLRSVKLPGGMKLTLFSPDKGKLRSLIDVWEKECRKAGIIKNVRGRSSEKIGKDSRIEQLGEVDVEGLAGTNFLSDAGEANGSSIAVLAEYEGKVALLTGDAHVDRLIESIKLYMPAGGRLKLDAFKVAHHGSEHNVSPELLNLIDCPRFLVSTNGSYFQHPTASAVARIIKFGGENRTFFFNYKTSYTELWDDMSLKKKYGYEVVFPASRRMGSLTVNL